MNAVDVFLIAVDGALRLEPKDLRKTEAKKAQASSVKEVTPAQTIAKLNGAISV
jgi:hypothetical protein